jgi:hypothetical protein
MDPRLLSPGVDPITQDGRPRDRFAELVLPQVNGGQRLRVLAEQLSGPVQCERTTYRRDANGFTDFVTICWTHRTVGAEYGTLEESVARTQCPIAIELTIARTRINRVVREGFRPVGLEVSHGR